MPINIKNWSTQIKKGYLEICVLSLIQNHKKLYGFSLIQLLEEHGISIKEGTLYPLLSRMANDGVLKATWETKELKGHPRKFYSLSKNGEKMLLSMKEEYEQMFKNFIDINESGGKSDTSRIRVLPR